MLDAVCWRKMAMNSFHLIVRTKQKRYRLIVATASVRTRVVASFAATSRLVSVCLAVGAVSNAREVDAWDI